MRVLIVKTSSMGDVLHTLPALTDAAQAIPGIRFDWVVEEGFAQIPSWHESVERVIPVAIRRWRKAWFSAPIKAERQAFREAVQAVKYDAIIDAQGLVKAPRWLLAWRTASSTVWTGKRPASRWRACFTTAATISRNSSTRWSVPVSCSPKPWLRETPDPGDYAIARHFLQHEASAAAPYLVFLHATTRDDKHWPETRWQELLDLLADSGVHISCRGAPRTKRRGRSGWRKAGSMLKCCRA